ncbi:MAG: enoyl-CoA hydratase-related protein [Pseudomonadota bacterium]
MSGRIDLEANGGVVTVTLNNPAKLNAMTKAMWLAFADVWKEVNADMSVRCVILKGAGERGFCPGNDIGEFATERSNAEQARALSAVMNDGREAMLACPHPVIASIQGACVGGGLEIAAMADMRIASEVARFGAPLNRIGLTMAFEEMLPIWKLTNKQTMFEMLVEGRIFDAEEAKSRGLVNRIVEHDALEQEVSEAAERIAVGPPLVNRWHKQFFARLEDPRPLEPQDYEEHYLAFETHDYQVGYRSFLSKSVPEFKGR